MLINLRNALMSGKRLPYDAEVEFLESTGTQYINTSIKPGPNTRAEIVFAMTTFTANCGLFGARGQSISNDLSYNLFIVSNAGQNQVRWDWSGNGVYATTQAETSTVATYSLGVAGSTITRDGASVLNVSAGKVAIDYPIYIFNFNNVGTPWSTGANARFWSVKIYEGQTLVFDGIPVRKGTVGYLYDRVTGKLFGNAGTGDFVLGQDVVPVEYIESHGVEFVNTGVTLSTGTQFKVDICPTYSTGDRKYLGSDAANFGLAQLNGKWRLRVYGWSLTSIDVVTDSFTTVEKNTNGWFINGTNVYSDWGPNAAVPFLCFAWLESNNTISTASALCKISHLEITDNGTLVRDFIPVRVGTDTTSWEGAMMDVLTRRIYRNAGTGAFTYGNDLKYPIPAA